MGIIYDLVGDVKNNNTNNIPLGRLIASRLFSPKFLKVKDFSDTRANPDHTKYSPVTSGNHHDYTIHDFVNKSLFWNKMSKDQKFVFGDEVLSWLMTNSGIKRLFVKYVPDIKGNTVGHISDDDINLSIKDLIETNNPFELISTLAHEKKHYEQQLNNLLVKKSDLANNLHPVIFSEELTVYEHFVKDKNFREDLYTISTTEQDARLESLRVLRNLRSWYEDLSGQLAKKTLENLDRIISNSEKYVVTTAKKQIAMNSTKSKIEELDNQIKNWTFDLCDRLEKLSKDPARLHEYLDSTTGSTEISNYLHFATYSLDQMVHRDMLKVLLQHNRLEAIDFVNSLKFEHTDEELEATTKLIHNYTSDILLLPTMYRYLSHISPSEIKKNCSIVIGNKKTIFSEASLKIVFTEELHKDKNLSRFMYTREIEPDNASHFSFLINNLYSSTYNKFVREMGPRYLLEYTTLNAQLQGKDQDHEYITDEATKTYTKEIDPVLKSEELNIKDLKYTILCKPITDSQHDNNIVME